MIFISPPFGNYLNIPKTISIKGSFTLEPRNGLFFQILKTLRYSFEDQAWINKIGLRNKGLDWAIKNYKQSNHEQIISIAIINKNDIPKILKKIPEDMNIEVNVSCPNAEKEMVNQGLSNFVNDKRKWCIIKVSPTTCFDTLDNYYKQGFRQFHCSNTLPTPRGGMSGHHLIPYNEKLIKHLKTNYKDIQVIGGGGIQTNEDLILYKNFGADHMSISTLCFHPFKFFNFYKNLF